MAAVLDPDDVRRYAEVARRVIGTPYPYATGHTSSGPHDVDVTPERLHPAFHGSFDWHSSVHMHWSLVQLLSADPAAAGEEATVALLDGRLTPQAVAVEARYLRAHPGWERPYGWGWAAALAAATSGSAHPAAASWHAATVPLFEAAADLTLAWLPQLAYPVRHGVHANTAFGLVLLHAAAARFGHEPLTAAITRSARGWFGADADAPVAIEPSGSDFLSPTLTEALLMERVLPPDEFSPWLQRFLPRLGEPGDPLAEVPQVLDPTDGQAVHLHGLGLSRAWAFRILAPHLPPDRAEAVTAAADAGEAAAASAVTDGDFMSTHWLVSFALLARGLGPGGGSAGGPYGRSDPAGGLSPAG